jgi:hypothetical protein
VAAPLIVTGFHRSGTSAAARLLTAAGLDLGHELVGSRRSNPYGHFEDRSVVAIHQQALEAEGRSWDTSDADPVEASPDLIERLDTLRTGRTSPWGFKDPRACFFLDAWAEAAEEPRVVLMHRPARDAAESLLRREARRLRTQPPDRAAARRLWSDPPAALRSWLAHNRAALAFARRSPESVLAVSFQALGGGAALVDLVESRWGLGLRPTPTFSRVDPRWPESGRPPLRSLDATGLEGEISHVESALVELEHATMAHHA